MDINAWLFVQIEAARLDDLVLVDHLQTIAAANRSGHCRGWRKVMRE
jgi:hypothetical protein